MSMPRSNKKKGQKYDRFGTALISDILGMVGPDAGKGNVCGHMVGLDHSRLLCFKDQGTTCVVCGVKGEFFAVEKITHGNDVTPHLNLYALDEHGHEILMTKDHIVPRSDGGKNHVSNLQPMCVDCNRVRGRSVHPPQARLYILLPQHISVGRALATAVRAGHITEFSLEHQLVVCKLTDRQFKRAEAEGRRIDPHCGSTKYVMSKGASDKSRLVAICFQKSAFKEWPVWLKYLAMWS
jgi:hypothetical protein